MGYNPDVWVVLGIANKSTGQVDYKVMAGWYGGFAKADSWRLNSGITSITKEPDNDQIYNIQGGSGSTYFCHKNTEKTSMLTHSIIQRIMEEANKSGEYEVNIVPSEEVYKIFNKDSNDNSGS